MNVLNEQATEIMEACLDPDSEEVSTTIAGYVAKKLAKRSKCNLCKQLLTANEMDLKENHYLKLLSRGSLTRSFGPNSNPKR